MKRVLMLLLVLMLIPAALSEDMVVVKCKEWVSLRETPSKSAAALRRVPLDSRVEDCAYAENGFTRCTYDGVTGYILSDYLEPVEPDEPADRDSWSARTESGCVLSAQRTFAEDGEHMTLTCTDPQGNELWRKVTSGQPTELDCTYAFLAGTRETPRAMLYNAEEGLMCLDMDTGDALWTLTPDQIHLGAGLAHFVDDAGRMYISGYYGPDPVCIDMNGNVLWRSSPGRDDIFWPYRITVSNGEVTTQYETMGDTSGRVIYDANDGHLLRTEIDP